VPRLVRSWWDSGASTERYPPLPGSTGCDVAVIGGGVAGLHAALRLVRDGADVVLLERSHCGGGTSGRSSGFITPDSELQLDSLIRRFGEAEAAVLWSIAEAGVDLIAGTARVHELQCDLLAPDCLFLGVGRSGAKSVRAEARARDALGYRSTLYEEAALPAVHSGRYQAGVRYGGTWAIDPLRYCQGLRALLRKQGVRIYENTEVGALSGATAVSKRGDVAAQHCIVCIDKMPKRFNPRAWRKYYHAQTYLAISEPLTQGQAARLFPEAPLQCWDTRLVYTYYRLTGDNRLLLGGGSPLTTFARKEEPSPRVIESVIRGFRKRVPALGQLEFIAYWPGLIDITQDLLPLAAPDPENPMVQYILGPAGLPWAAWCGNHVAGRLSRNGEPDFSRFFGWERDRLVPDVLERVIGKPLSFTLDYFHSRR
jgi:gamma-glutamylputrescine oxidase